MDGFQEQEQSPWLQEALCRAQGDGGEVLQGSTSPAGLCALEGCRQRVPWTRCWGAGPEPGCAGEPGSSRLSAGDSLGAAHPSPGLGACCEGSGL